MYKLFLPLVIEFVFFRHFIICKCFSKNFATLLTRSEVNTKPANRGFDRRWEIQKRFVHFLTEYNTEFRGKFPELLEIATTTSQTVIYRLTNINIICVLNTAQLLSSSLRWYSSNRSNTSGRTSFDFQTREELKIHDKAKYSLTNFEIGGSSI